MLPYFSLPISCPAILSPMPVTALPRNVSFHQPRSDHSNLLGLYWASAMSLPVLSFLLEVPQLPSAGVRLLCFPCRGSQRLFQKFCLFYTAPITKPPSSQSNPTAPSIPDVDKQLRYNIKHGPCYATTPSTKALDTFPTY